MAAGSSVSGASIASQNRWWSMGLTDSVVNLGPVVVAHQPAKASFPGGHDPVQPPSARYAVTDAHACRILGWLACWRRHDSDGGVRAGMTVHAAA